MSENRIIRAAIAAWLMRVEDVGQVHEFERYAKDDKAFRQLYTQADGSLQGWHIRRVGRSQGSVFDEVRTTWELRAFRALADGESSELVFDDLLDRVIAEYRKDPTLGGVVFWPTNDDAWAPELVDSGPAMFGGVLCHCAKLRLMTRHVGDDAPQPGN